MLIFFDRSPWGRVRALPGRLLVASGRKGEKKSGYDIHRRHGPMLAWSFEKLETGFQNVSDWFL